MFFSLTIHLFFIHLPIFYIYQSIHPLIFCLYPNQQTNKPSIYLYIIQPTIHHSIFLFLSNHPSILLVFICIQPSIFLSYLSNHPSILFLYFFLVNPPSNYFFPFFSIRPIPLFFLIIQPSIFFFPSNHPSYFSVHSTIHVVCPSLKKSYPSIQPSFFTIHPTIHLSPRPNQPSIFFLLLSIQPSNVFYPSNHPYMFFYPYNIHILSTHPSIHRVWILRF